MFAEGISVFLGVNVGPLYAIFNSTGLFPSVSDSLKPLSTDTDAKATSGNSVPVLELQVAAGRLCKLCV